MPAVVLSILYARTLQPSTGNVFSIDTTKFDYLGLVLGTAHPPGYPLYTMLDALIVRVVPFGSVAARANLLSAVCAVLLGVVAVDILLRLRVRPVLAAGGATAIGLIPELWMFAVVAEVYTMTALFVGLVLACVLRFDTTGRRGWLRAGVVILALSFAHATSDVLLMPGLLLYLSMRRVRWLFRLRELAVLLPASAALALLPYLYLFWRTAAHAAFLDVRVTGVRSFVAVITGARYGPKMFAVPVSQLPGRIVELGHAGWVQFGPFLGLCVLGLLALPLRRRRLAAAMLVTWAVCIAVFVLFYRVGDWTTMLLPFWLVLGLWAVVGLDTVVAGCTALLGRAGAARPVVRMFSGLVALGSVVALVWTAVVTSYDTVDQSRTHSQVPVDAAIGNVPDNSVIFVSSYGVRHQFLYRLLPGQFGQHRNVWAAKGGRYSGPEESTAQIRSYCEPGPDPWVWSRQERAEAPGVPRNLPTYVYGGRYARSVTAEGLSTHRVSGRLYTVSCPP